MATPGRSQVRILADYVTGSETDAKKDSGDGPPPDDMEEAYKMQERTSRSQSGSATPWSPG